MLDEDGVTCKVAVDDGGFTGVQVTAGKYTTVTMTSILFASLKTSGKESLMI